MSKGVDVLIHETQIPYPGESKEAKLANVSMIVHSTPAQVAHVFNESSAKTGYIFAYYSSRNDKRSSYYQ
jgi:ribonuclease BN (tRNA processing enzyme)